MNNLVKKIIVILIPCISFPVFSTINIDFENKKGYKNIRLYDVWTDSPFNTGELEGNWDLILNPFKTDTTIFGQYINDSENVLAAQRSRFGSNRFGICIDLEDTFPLLSNEQFVHVMLHKPKEGRVMLIGLGSRKERLDQYPYTEQFWVLSKNSIGTNKWYDAVFPIKGAEGIDIRSLVIVPDCESPHDLKEDFIFYIDNICINDKENPFFQNEYYPIAGNKNTTTSGRLDKFSNSISLHRVNEDLKFDVSQRTNNLLYQDLLEKTFFVKPGETVIPEIDYNGKRMHAYCYIDYNQDGDFNVYLDEEGYPVEGSELVSYNYHKGRNSKGNKNINENLGKKIGILPSFTIPDTIGYGMYRMRYKIDWDCLDPIGNTSTDNRITDNGGMIADIMLCVYDDITFVNDNQLNGEILTENGIKLNKFSCSSDQPLILNVKPEKGFYNGGVEIIGGYNLEENEYLDILGNPRFYYNYIPSENFDSNNMYTLPWNKVRGNLLLKGKMVENNH